MGAFKSRKVNHAQDHTSDTATQQGDLMPSLMDVRWWSLKILGELAYRLGRNGVYYRCLNTMCATGHDWYGQPTGPINYRVWPWMLTRRERRFLCPV